MNSDTDLYTCQTNCIASLQNHFNTIQQQNAGNNWSSFRWESVDSKTACFGHTTLGKKAGCWWMGRSCGYSWEGEAGTAVGTDPFGQQAPTPSSLQAAGWVGGGGLGSSSTSVSFLTPSHCCHNLAFGSSPLLGCQFPVLLMVPWASPAPPVVSQGWAAREGQSAAAPLSSARSREESMSGRFMDWVSIFY